MTPDQTFRQAFRTRCWHAGRLNRVLVQRVPDHGAWRGSPRVIHLMVGHGSDVTEVVMTRRIALGVARDLLAAILRLAP